MKVFNIIHQQMFNDFRILAALQARRMSQDPKDGAISGQVCLCHPIHWTQGSQVQSQPQDVLALYQLHHQKQKQYHINLFFIKITAIY